jgi:molybdenum cofactor cytidylyltransferase
VRLGQVAAVLTAAGLSSRMGRNKALLDWQGRPLIAHQAAALAGCGQLVVVLGHEAEALRRALPEQANLRVVLNPDHATGRVGSLIAGFRAIEGAPEGIMVVAVDQPVPLGLPEWLAAQLGEAARIVQPGFAGRRGHPVLFKAELLPELLAIREDAQGLRAVVSRHADARRVVEAGREGVLWDLNTPEEYAALARPDGDR